MSLTNLIAVITSLLTLCLLVIVLFWIWPEQRVDVFRQEMFALRDELFDFAADGNISFEDPAYALLRQLMNGFIRYAHNLTPYRALLSFVRWKWVNHEQQSEMWTTHWNQALEKVSDSATREKLRAYHSKAGMLVLSQLVLSPGFLIAMVPLVVVTAIVYVPWTTLRKIFNSFNDRFPLSFLEEEAAKS